jgi:phosphosulfolactate synthase (CoM biosynthesis protein A)
VAQHTHDHDLSVHAQIGSEPFDVNTSELCLDFGSFAQRGDILQNDRDKLLK